VGSELPANFGQRPWRDADVGLKLTHRLGALHDVLAVVAERLPGARVRAHAGSGVVWVAADPTVAADAIRGLRSDVERYDGQLVVVIGPADLKRDADAWGPVRGLALMHRIKDQFDPDHRLAPGTFVGGI
jgi:glycolate oxidase FAD binding subunit